MRPYGIKAAKALPVVRQALAHRGRNCLPVNVQTAGVLSGRSLFPPCAAGGDCRLESGAAGLCCRLVRPAATATRLCRFLLAGDCFRVAGLCFRFVRPAATTTWSVIPATCMSSFFTAASAFGVGVAGLWWYRPLPAVPSAVDQGLVDVLKAQLDRCGPENLVCPACPACPACAQCTPWWAVAALTAWILLLVAFCCRGFLRLHASRSEARPHASRPRPLPAGAFFGSSPALEAAWDRPQPAVGDRPTDLGSAAFVATPSSLRLRR